MCCWPVLVPRWDAVKISMDDDDDDDDDDDSHYTGKTEVP